nr:prolyl oligopeptidase family serine peptidase [Cytophagales bacterium]
MNLLRFSANVKMKASLSCIQLLYSLFTKKTVLVVGVLVAFLPAYSNALNSSNPSATFYPVDSLPHVITAQSSDLLGASLKRQAMLNYATHQLPDNMADWMIQREALVEKIMLHGGIKRHIDLSLDMRETRSTVMEGYTVKNIYFQTLPGVYATANLYVPDGKGPFPAVVSMHGHWREGKIAESVQALGHTLAKNGYVSLVIDAFGSGERTTIHGDFEYHGANLGASLMNIGETLLGVQVADNMRAVDLLVSLPYVDEENIGATGASGGGNQTMWFAALDDRVKAAVPIVSVGTFESAVMGSNCVCELLPGGLTFTESAGVLALYAPRALKMCNHDQDSNPTFFPSEMRRSFHNVQPVFKLHGVEKNVAYAVFDLTHGYWKEDREAMLGWFDLHLKGVGTGESRAEKPFNLLPMEDLLVFPIGKRSPLILPIEEYSRRQGSLLRKQFLDKKSFSIESLRKDLKEVLGITGSMEIKEVSSFSPKSGWDRVALHTQEGTLIPLMHAAPTHPDNGYSIIAYAGGKSDIPDNLIAEIKSRGEGIVVVELSGTGEAASTVDAASTNLAQFHTLSRARLWLGKTMIGEWVRELDLVSRYIQQNYQPSSIKFDGNKEAAVAALLFSAVEPGAFRSVTLRQIPVSYLFDNRENVDFFSMGIHLPGFLEWGDISLVTGITATDVTIVDPLSMSGVPISNENLSTVTTEFQHIKQLLKQSGTIQFQRTGN